MELTERIPELIFKELRYEINEAESKELQEWIARSEAHHAFYEKFVTDERLHAEIVEFYEFKRNVWSKIGQEMPEMRPGGVVLLFSRRVWSYAAAVILCLLISGGGYWWMRSSQKGPIPGKQDIVQRYKNDVPPGGNKAVLTLGDGSRIVLDSIHNGAVAAQGSSEVIKLDSGRLAYNSINEKSAGAEPASLVYNTLATPRGGQYQLALPDGTKVWLNAATTLRFPVSFRGGERRVELTGEAYFEVASDKSRPFKVKVNQDLEVEVLGTHFNVMAYEDEPAVRTTLLEGAVRVSKGAASKMVRPGQQAIANANGELEIVKAADTEAAVAWKSGYFQFHIADIGSVMRQLARWYDVDVYYEGKKPEDHFVGEISRNNNLSDVLKMLELNGVLFRVEGKKLIVL